MIKFADLGGLELSQPYIEGLMAYYVCAFSGYVYLIINNGRICLESVRQGRNL